MRTMTTLAEAVKRGLPVLETPLTKQYSELMRAQAAGELNYDNPKGYPNGFFRIVSLNGESLGYGFYCQHCKVTVCGLDKTSVVRHCGTVSKLPTGLLGWLRKHKYRLERWF